MIALDLFCGGGGSCIGMQQAGFEVIGIDIKRRKNYPGYFIQADINNLPVDPMDFEFVWASPPCQRYSKATRCRPDEKYLKYPCLIKETREILLEHPFTVIENVPQAPIRADLVLNGPAFGLNNIVRKRIFELSFWCWQLSLPRPTNITFSIRKTLSYTNQSEKKKRLAAGLPLCLPKRLAQAYMGIPADYKMTVAEIGEAVPPPMAEYIASQAILQIKHIKDKL